MQKVKVNSATRNEIIFIQHLGTGRWSRFGVTIGRVNCLRGYLQGSLIRINWGDIDKKTAMATAAKLLIKIS